jgi:hypothetical protein
VVTSATTSGEIVFDGSSERCARRDQAENGALTRGIVCLLEAKFQLKKHAAKRLSHSCSAILFRWINNLRRFDPVLIIVLCR